MSDVIVDELLLARWYVAAEDLRRRLELEDRLASGPPDEPELRAGLVRHRTRREKARLRRVRYQARLAVKTRAWAQEFGYWPIR